MGGLGIVCCVMRGIRCVFSVRRGIVWSGCWRISVYSWSGIIRVMLGSVRSVSMVTRICAQSVITCTT